MRYVRRAWEKRAMLTTYTALKSFHVLAAVIWVGGAAMSQVLAIRATRANEPARIVGVLGDIEFVGTRVFLPSSLLLVATGFGLIADGDLDFELWIVLGLIVWALSAATGSGFLGPESGRIAAIVGSEGPDSPAALARIRRIFLISRIELLLLVLIVFDMVIKPGT
jgi:uncharacterized membrane protein